LSSTLYILIGLPGSGKSWYALHKLNGISQINQDEMGGDGHLKAFCKCLSDGDSTVVDRVNFDREQRARYIGPARAKGYRVVCIWFNANQAVCLERLSIRKGHPSVSEDDDHKRILERFVSLMTFPTEDEYDELRVVLVTEQVF